MGSVPRINRHLATVLLLQAVIDRHINGVDHPFINLLIQYDKWSKGVSILSYQLPYTLQLTRSYPITSNSKAA